jgi:hypothetical protein
VPQNSNVNTFRIEYAGRSRIALPAIIDTNCM